MLVGAARAQRTEAALVVRARGPLRCRVDVQIEAVLPVRARLVAGKVAALGHPAQVILVQELACLRLLAEAAEPMLAHETAR